MTHDAQQPEHCEHECICMKYANTNAYGYPCTHNKEPTSFTVNSPCEHDTRTRPHTPVPVFNIEEFGKRIGVILDVEFSMIRESKRVELHRRVCDIAEVIMRESLRQQSGEQE